MKKRILSLLAALLALSCCAACDKSGNSGASAEADGAGTTPAETEPDYALPEAIIDEFVGIEGAKTVRDSKYTMFYYCKGGVSYDVRVTELTAPDAADGTVILEKQGTGDKTQKLEDLRDGCYYRMSVIAYDADGGRSPEVTRVLYCSHAVVDEEEIARACAEYGIGAGSDAYAAITGINRLYFDELSGKLEKPLVFFFEGCGVDTSKRFGAMCVAVKNGKILYVNRRASTLPDYPFDPKHDNGKDNPTVIDGVFSFTTSNHNGETACLLINPPPVIRCTTDRAYYASTASGIEVHRRFADGVAPADETWANSSGCFMVGAAGTNEFRDFMIALGILPAGTPTLGKSQKSVSGYVVVNHQYAHDYMSSLGYKDGAITAITAKTAALLEAAAAK